MLFVEVRRFSLSKVSAIILCSLLAERSVAQQAPVPNKSSSKIAEVSGYLSQSDEALACDPAAAESLAKRSLETISGARETDPILIDALGDLKSQSNLKIVAAEKRRAELDTAQKEAQTALKQAHPLTAMDLLDKTDAKGCYAGFKAIRAQIADREFQAGKRTLLGDEALQKHPKKAVELYHKAESLDTEIPGLATKIANAQNIEHQKAVHREHKAVACAFLLPLCPLIVVAK